MDPIFQAYLNWLASMLGSVPSNAVQQLTAGITPSQQGQQVIPTNAPEPSSTVTADDLLGYNYTPSLPEWAKKAPGSFAGVSAPEVMAPIQAAPYSREAALQYVADTLGFGYQLPPGRYPREVLKGVASDWEKKQEGFGEAARLSVWNPTMMRYEGILAEDPTNVEANLMLGLFDQIASGERTAKGIIEDDESFKLAPGQKDYFLTTDMRQKLEAFETDSIAQQENIGKIATAKQEIYDKYPFLPSPEERYQVPQELVAQIWTRQKSGLTEAQAQEQQYRKDLAGVKGFVPRTREDIRAQVMAEMAGPDFKGKALAGKKLPGEEGGFERQQKAEKVASAAEKVVRGGGTADRAEAVAKQVAANYVRGGFGRQEDKKRLDELNRITEERYLADQYRAMRGEVVKGGEEWATAENSRRKMEAAKQYEADLTKEIARKLNETGTPFDDAMRQASLWVASRSKTYSYPGGPTGGYPY